MNKTLKTILIFINLVILFFACKWYSEKEDYEPLIIVLAQLSTILILLFEKNITKNFIKTIDNSEINLDKKSSSHIEDVKKSKINIR